MGIGNRLFDMARSNLNSLLDRAAKSELEARTEDELQAELQRRRSATNAQEMERQRAAAMEAAAKARGDKRPKPDPRTRGSARRAAEAMGRAHRLRTLYAELGVPQTATHDELKSAYRALMRAHHPDHHAGDPRKQKAASDRSATITTAYAELELLLKE